MKLSLAPSELQRVLAYVMPVISKQISDPLFLNVLLEADAGQLRLRATDTIVTVGARVAADVERKGTIGVSAERLHKIASNLPDVEKVKLEMKDNSLHVSAKRSKSKLATVDASDFPHWPQPTSPGVTLAPKQLLACLRWVKHAMIDDANRPQLSGVRLVVQERTYLVASTCDSRRLARTAALVPDTQGDLQVFLPSRATRVLMKLCEWTKEGNIHLLAVRSDAFFWNDAGLGYACKLVGAHMLDPDAIRPSGNPKSMVSFERLKMVDALKRVRAIEETEVQITYEAKSIKLNVANQEGEAEEHIPASLHGASASTKISGDYLADALGSMKSAEVYLYVWELHLPMMLMPSGDEETYDLLMPMS